MTNAIRAVSYTLYGVLALSLIALAVAKLRLRYWQRRLDTERRFAEEIAKYEETMARRQAMFEALHLKMSHEKLFGPFEIGDM